jgi:hypothetical protein
VIWALLASGARIPTPGPYRDMPCYLPQVSMDPWGDDVPIVHVDNFSYGLLNPVLGGGVTGIWAMHFIAMLGFTIPGLFTAKMIINRNRATSFWGTFDNVRIVDLSSFRKLNTNSTVNSLF